MTAAAGGEKGSAFDDIYSHNASILLTEQIIKHIENGAVTNTQTVERRVIKSELNVNTKVTSLSNDCELQSQAMCFDKVKSNSCGGFR